MANKNSVNIQLNINTAFTNIDQAVKDFKSKISNLNISSQLGNDLVNNFQKQAVQIKNTLQQVGNYDLSAGGSGNTKEYTKLVQQLKDQYASLNSMIKQYSDTFIAKTTQNIEKQKEEIAVKTTSIQAYEKELAALEEGKDAYLSLQAGSTDLTKKEKELAQTYESNIPKINEINEKIKALTKSRSAHQGALTKSERALKAHNQVLEEEKNQSKVIKNEIDQVTNSRKQEVAQLKESEIQLDKNTKSREEEQEALEKWQRTSSTFGKDFINAAKGSDSLSDSLSRQIIQWTSFNAIVKVAQRAISDIIQTYQELDDNLSAISAVSGISTQELWGDMPSMIDNANKLALSINDLTDGMLTLYQQGLNTVEVETRLDAAGKLAAISQQDLGTAVDQLTAIMNTFNLSTEDSARVVDILANESANSAISVAELGTALQPVASLAASAGMSLETTTAFITTMESTTRQSASVIGNALKTIIARFQQLKTSSDDLEDGTSANDVEKALASAGVALRDATGNFRDFDEVIMELSSKWDTLDSNTQRYIATVGAGTRQQSQFIALVSNYAKNVENISTATNSAGAAEKQFYAVSNNLSSALTRLDNSFASLKTSWTEGINVITLFVDVLTELIKGFASLPTGIQAASGALVVLSARLLATSTAQGKLASAQQIVNILNKTTLDSTQKQSVADLALAAAKKKLTAEQFKATLETSGLNDELKEQIVLFYNQTTGIKSLIQGFKNLGTTIKSTTKQLTTFLTSPIGIALSALAVSVGLITFHFEQEKEAAKKAQEAIDDLNSSSQEHADQAQAYETEIQSLQDYAEKLKEAYSAGQDLTDIKKEIANSFDESVLGVDAERASYEDLTQAINETIDAKEKLVKIEQAQSIIDKENANKQEAQRLKELKNNVTGLSSNAGEWKYTENGKEKSMSAASFTLRAKREGKTEKELATGLSATLTYNLKDANGNVIFSGTEEEFDKELDRLRGNFYTKDEAEALYVQSKDNGYDFGNTFNFDQIINTIQLAKQQLGSEIVGENGLSNLYFDFQTELESVQQQIQAKLGISANDFFAYINGNYSQLSSETLNALQTEFDNLSAGYNADIESSLEDSTNSVKGAMVSANESYKQAFDDAYAKIADYGIISREDAEALGLGTTERVVNAFESGGVEAAELIRDILNGAITKAFADVEIPSEIPDEIANQFKEVLGDSFSDIDFSSLGTAVEDLLSSFDSGDLSFSNLIESLELLETLCPGVSDQINSIVAALQAEKAAQEETFTTMTNVNQVWSDFNQGLQIAQNLASETGASFEEMSTLAELLGTTVDQLIASGSLTAIGDKYYTNAQQAQEWITSLYGLSDAELASAEAEYRAAEATASSTASKIAGYKQQLDAAIASAKGTLATAQANVNAGPTFNKLKNAGIAAAKGMQQLNIQVGDAAPGVMEVADANVATADTLDQLVAELEQYSAKLGDAQAEQEAMASDAGAKADFIAGLRTQLSGAKEDWQNYGKAASSGGGGGSNKAADGVNEAKEALDAQKEALQKVIDQWEDYKEELESQKDALEDQKDALEELNDKLKDNLELYLDLIKTKLEDEIDRQTTAVEAYYDAIKNTIQSQIDAFENQLDKLKRKADELQDKADGLQEEAEKQEDSLNKLYEAATSYYEAVQSGIDNEINLQDDAIEKNEYKISLLEQQKDAFQDQIDNLELTVMRFKDLLNLEKARDALANARNQKTRMVLTNGGGWRLKTDTAAVQDAQSNLASAEKDYQKELLERQQEKLDDQISELEEQNDKIEDIKEDLEEQKDSIDNIIQDWDDAADNLGKTTSELEEQTRLLEKIASATEAERNEMLQGFQSNVAQNNNQFQAAADATNEANQASNEYDYQNNADNQDSISAAIEALKQQQNLTDEALKQYFENLLSNNAEEVAIQQQMQELVNQIIQNGNGSLDAFLEYQGQINEALQAANEFASNQAEYINKINETIGFYEEWSNRLDMTSSEINERQQIMNEINNATLASLLEGGSTFNQLQGQYDEIVRNNDEAVRIQEQIDGIDAQIDQVQDQIDSLKAQQEEISKQEQQLSNANTNKTTSAAKSAGSGVSKSVSNASTEISGATDKVNKSVGTFQTDLSFRLGVVNGSLTGIKSVLDQINQKDFNITVNSPASGYLGGVGGRSSGGPIGFSTGGVDDFTKTVAVHGTKNRPELVLNNSQSAALFKYIDSMTRIPTLSSAGSARNALQAFNNTTNNTTNEGTSFTGCEFNIESNANNLDSLVRELKQSSSIKRK